MGSGESTTRKVSFGVDEEDRVRILRGVKLSEDVLQRMRGVANIPPERTPSPTPTSLQKETGSSPSRTPSPQPPQSPQARAPTSTKTSTSKPTTNAKDEQKRYERQQAILKEELTKVARREREAAKEQMTRVLSREKDHTRQEVEKAKQLAQRLQKKDVELKALDAFYKEQLAQLEKRNMERFKESKEQFHEAASKTEVNVRPRNTEPVCPGLQAQILSCYRENRSETLRCSDLAKEYIQCIDAAKKSLLVNHG
ncbi:MICOS complex subunit mic25a [Myripristis murdjan]|uniref:Coiled-coil-helix-coiled-coil-helix domain containing 6a n=1 Tax=Myripristis murdjan TaxID=586833 RepID=A0A667XIG8_9TELE|nr:MICOS complex subunit mic25a-like [Myripristis murdjan]